MAVGNRFRQLYGTTTQKKPPEGHRIDVAILQHTLGATLAPFHAQCWDKLRPPQKSFEFKTFFTTAAEV